MNSNNMVYCFLDTNILIHFKTFDEVEWTEVTHTSQVVLTLAPVILMELNQHKDDGSNEWRRKRARTLVSKLKSLLVRGVSMQPIEMRNSTSIMDIPNEPLVDWQVLGLDPAVNDDRLIASIIKFKEQHPSDRVVLITDDFLVQRKATGFDIQVIYAEGSIDVIERQSEEASTIRKLEKEIQDLQRRIPEPRLSFWENKVVTNTVTRAVSPLRTGFLSEEEITQQIVQKRQGLEQLTIKAQGSVSKSEIDEFVQVYDNYIKQLQQALILNRTKDYGLQLQLQFILQNIGSAPATDLELSLQFPEKSLVVGASHELEMEYWGKVRIPKEPVPEWMKRKNPLDFGYITTPHIARDTEPPEQPKPKGPLYNVHDRSIVWFTTPKLRHKEDWYLNPLAAFLPPETSGGFEITYSMHADNLLNKIEGRLNVVLQSAT